jgi:FKBP-type peptidyl-prolyl cis-trans isomerase FkpA
MKKILVFLLAVSFGLTACDKSEDYEDQLAIDKDIIEDYLADNGLTAQSTASGLYYIIDDAGSSDKPNINSEVTVRYVGKLLNGSVFDNGGGEAVSFPLANVIEGWQEGIPLFGAGGSGTLYIPSGLGYGTTGSRSIAPNTVLIFDVDLVSFR